MATASVTNNFANGTPADAEEVDTNFADLVSFLNNSVIHRDGTKTMTANFDANSNKIVNLTTGTATGDAVNKGQLDTATGAGAWTSWTPTVSQPSSVTNTNTYSRYVRIGRTIHFVCRLDITGTGTSGSEITVSLPVTAAAGGGLVVGSGIVVDNGTAFYVGVAVTASGTTMQIATYGNVGYVGANPSFALASGDIVHVYGTYEASS